MSLPVYPHSLPGLTVSQMVEVDRLMMEDYGIDLLQMMENAGRNLAHLARVRFLAGDPRDKRVAVAAGSGGNGGGALVAARRLSNWGAEVSVLISRRREALAPVPAKQLGILERLGIPIVQAETITNADPTDVDLLIDGVIGYSLVGAPRDRAAKLIEWLNGRKAPTLALDVPSGLDATNGTVYDPAVRADATMTLALPKRGLLSPSTRAHVGELYLADIGVPPSLYAETSLSIAVPPLFAVGEVVRLMA